MATGIILAIVLGIAGMIFFYLKDAYQNVVLKKSKDEILLEKIKKEYSDFCSKLNLFKSKEKIEKERKEYLDVISLLEKRIREERNE